MHLRLLVFVGAVTILAPATLRAHHSFAAEFDINQPVKLAGVLTKVEIVNPHGWLYIDVKKDDGTMENWAIEAGSAIQLLRRGLRKTDFPPGRVVVVEGYRARNGRRTMNGRTVTFKDGRNFFLGAPEAPTPTSEQGR
jgi:hypothetical protein